ncbi:MATE family efflux transporter [Hydrogeniiclostridium mannosilyticum]|uniref:MATE family efflux transporter n=1 Tax=Hydrogeniiclostridium mannosilyticum TaxID=2764322 RepID=A0A328UMZ9_9FIRM|nr:MATE family efflux transporter [Hydrogeniiclostridium mannosilyticum]MBS6162871.1 MATE family efflux transporter [Clostridiales bacterium]RAQ30823.1 MATE family efflux transporter [Hydrogeniiclostridium mannosilyticum]
MALQNLINVGVSSADVIMLGQVGETVLSAASLAGQVQFIMTLVFFGLTSGAAVLTAQYWGKGDTRTIEKVMGIAMRFSLMVGLAFTLAAWLIPEVLMSIYTSEPEVISEGCKYLRIVAVAYIPISITTIYLNIMRSVERVVISTVVYLISLVTNVILNAVFIFGLFGLPAMGIMGAALATMIARFVELAIVLFYSKKMNRTIRFRISDLFVRDGFLFRDFLRYSIPVVLNELMWGAGASMNSAVIGHLGSAATAANSVAQVTRQLATVVAFGIANAAAIMIGKAIGAGDVERAKNYGARFTKLTLLAGVAGAVVVLIVRPIVMASMTLSPEAEGYLSMMMLVMSYFVIGQAYNTTMVVGVFRAGGDTRFGLALDVISMWCCSILLGAIAAFVLKWSVPVVYIILMSDEVLKVPFTTWRYKTRVWLKNVTR